MKKVLSFLLVLAMLLAVIPMQVLAADEKNSEQHLRTSQCHYDYLDLTIKGGTVHIEGVITLENLGRISAELRFENENQSYGSVDTRSGKQFSMDIDIRKTPCTVEVFTWPSGTGMGYSYCFGRIVIEGKNGEYRFAKSTVADSNAAMLSVWADPKQYLDDTVSEKVKTLSDRIVGNEKDEYQKLYLINAWVADHIYYDYAYYYNTTARTTLTAEDIIDTRRTVCAGYANLAQALVRAQGIPCMNVSTYALGVSTNGGSYAYSTTDNSAAISNHAHVEAFVNDRWVIMDPTWDSNNKYYADDDYQYQAPNGFYYFDIAPEVFALDHKIVSRAGVSVSNVEKLKNNSGTPSAWAVDEVNAAKEMGLIPYMLQSRYQNGVTRAEAAQLLVLLIEKTSGLDIGDFISEYGEEYGIYGNYWRGDTFADSSDVSVLACRTLGIINGIGNNRFDPDAILTREQITAMLNRTAGVLGVSTDSYRHSFTDVAGRWCDAELGWPSAMGIIRGVGNNRFNPTGQLTREQAITMMYRTLNAISAW